MRKLVAAAICLLSLSLSVTTGRKCIKEARTRTGKKMFGEQQLRRVDKALSRAGDIPEGSWICLSHRNLILAEDKRCSMFLQFLAHAQTFDRGVYTRSPGRVSFICLSLYLLPCGRQSSWPASTPHLRIPQYSSCDSRQELFQHQSGGYNSYFLETWYMKSNTVNIENLDPVQTSCFCRAELICNLARL